MHIKRGIKLEELRKQDISKFVTAVIALFKADLLTESESLSLLGLD